VSDTDPFGLGGLFDNKGPSGFGTQFGQKKEEKAPPWEAKEINDLYYIPLSQVADLLEMNSVLPKVSKGIRVRVESLKLKKEMEKE
jgi:hypothetical protein